MLAKVHGSALYGIEAILVTIEVNVDKGIGYHLVGLPDNAIRESNYRIAAALLNNGFRIPGKKIIINMAPADLRKVGASYDLPLALGILAASGQLNAGRLGEFVIMGELSLDGRVCPVNGALSIALKVSKLGFRGLILPVENAAEAAVVEGLEVYGAGMLSEVIGFFSGTHSLKRVLCNETAGRRNDGPEPPDFRDVKGQEGVKRCMEIAASGGHNVILIGPPGSGKTMIARRLPGILPPMNLEESLETTRIHSVAGGKKVRGLIHERPFRSPHHTISASALAGGGAFPMPGEISLAHNGVLFLDELPEFKRQVLEVLRQPLEERHVTISRARASITYPSSFMLVASMNPSPSGDFPSPSGTCSSTPSEVRRYFGRISGPLLDRIDMHMEVSPIPFEELSSGRKGEESKKIRSRVVRARARQQDRFSGRSGMHCNSQMGGRQLRQYCSLEKASLRLLRDAMQQLGLSARAYDRILKVSRTIADLDNSPVITEAHLAEAIQYRSMDRVKWMGQGSGP